MNAFYSAPGVNYSGTATANDVVLLAELGTKVIGCVRLCEEERHLILRGMNVHPEHQRHGIGTRMLLEVASLIAERTCWCVPYTHLEMFYSQKSGFRKIAPATSPAHLQSRLEQYRAEGKDVIVMVRDHDEPKLRANL